MEHIGLAGMGFLWACVGITAGWLYATREDYRDPAAAVKRSVGAHRRIPPSFEATRRVPRWHVAARASVPACNRASLALVALYDTSGRVMAHTYRSRAVVRRHRAGLTGESAIWDTDGKGLMLALR